ncbi:hypothetical protein PRIPAC_81297 [Pristionchus pacificus]|uniref:CHCH domain-containing protein n=1 Tax=Pristionchus pacificus TaxID=54126 RepID=A0A2A6BXK4_PRIPA|nr:hypothetical protein PRIPAC_81297 [Pristionchus pacificus]|eukprot:PDM70635.1 hypothetical protein PRIPAC_46881 [Pristionchus pacificus]
MFYSPVLSKNALAKGRSVYPKVEIFSEVLPLCGKDKVNQKKSKAAASSCTQELQSLFGCLRKYEFDSLPCGKQNEAYKECVKASAKAAAEYKETSKKGALGEGSSQSMTTAQFNKLMQLFPQPDLGQSPYRQMKRLPSQSYSDDLFHRKSMPGKPS